MSHEQWEWSGGAGAAGGARCGEAAYGARLARRFLDARELERDARALMNLHNNRVGRKVRNVSCLESRMSTHDFHYIRSFYSPERLFCSKVCAAILRDKR